MLDAATFSLLTAPRRLVLRVPRLDAARSITIHDDSIDGVVARSTEARRAACAKAATSRSDEATSSGDDDFADGELDESSIAVTIHLQTLPVAATIGGKLWDASLLMSAWLCSPLFDEHLPRGAGPGGGPTRVLELGAGLGAVGFSAAASLSHAHVTLSDYDPALVENVSATLRLNPRLRPESVDVSRIDFRDFAESAKAPAACGGVYDALYGSFDVILAADVVYEQSHCALANVILAFLAAPPATDLADTRPPPRALLMLPDSRPRLREFVDALHASGLHCSIQQLVPTDETIACLRAAHEGWGAGGATFSLYVVERAPLLPPCPSPVPPGNL